MYSCHGCIYCMNILNINISFNRSHSVLKDITLRFSGFYNDTIFHYYNEHFFTISFAVYKIIFIFLSLCTFIKNTALKTTLNIRYLYTYLHFSNACTYIYWPQSRQGRTAGNSLFLNIVHCFKDIALNVNWIKLNEWTCTCYYIS